jgi:hypothetical protein
MMRSITSHLAGRYRLATFERAWVAAVRQTDRAGFALHSERLILLGALGVEPRGPLSAARRVDLEVRQAALALEVMTCRHAANRARSVLGIVRSREFRRWYLRSAGAPAGHAAVVSAYCAAHPGDPRVLGLSVRTELVPAR